MSNTTTFLAMLIGSGIALCPTIYGQENEPEQPDRRQPTREAEDRDHKKAERGPGRSAERERGERGEHERDERERDERAHRAERERDRHEHGPHHNRREVRPEEKIQHLMAAAEHLERAGLGDEAHRFHSMAQHIREDLERHRHNHQPGLEDIHHSLRNLHNMVRELQEQNEMLRRKMEQQ